MPPPKTNRYLCRIIVDLHGGELALDSTLGEGSTFSVRMRVSACDMPAERAAAVGEDNMSVGTYEWTNDGAGMRRARALVVEDAPLNRKIFVRLLERLNVECGVAADGLAAVEAFKAGGLYDMCVISAAEDRR